MTMRKRRYIRYQTGGTAILIRCGHIVNFLRGYQLSFGRKANLKHIKYQCGGALPLLAMAGKAAGKMLLKLLANKVLN